MSKRVIAFSLVALAVLGVWWWSSDSTGPAESDQLGEARQDRESLADSARARIRERPSREQRGIPEFATVDSQGNALLIPVKGVVLDVATEQPVADADIIFKDRNRRGESTASSDGSGNYSLKLAPGIYEVSAVGADHYGLASGFRLSSRQRDATHDIRMIGFAKVRGKVVDGHGSGIPDATVTFRSVFQDDKIGTKHVSLISPAASAATTASDGRFDLQVIPGTVLLEAGRDGGTARTRLEGVVAGQQYEARIVLDASASLSGVVVASSGETVGGAAVHVVTRDDIKELSRRVVETDEAGRFRLDAMTPGRAEVEARAEGHGTSPAVKKRIRSGQSIDVRLVLGESIALAGIVVDATGQPADGAAVVCRKHQSKLPPVQTETDAKGEFRCVVSAGPHQVSAEKPGLGKVRSDAVRAPADDLRLALVKPAGVRGLVRTPDGRPVTSFTIRVVRAKLTANKPSRRVTTPGTRFNDDDGAFDLPFGAPGTYYLVASAPGLSPSEPVGVEVPSGGYGEASFVLETGGSSADVVDGD